MAAARAFWVSVIANPVSVMPSGPVMAAATTVSSPLAGHRLDHGAGPVDADAVMPALAGVEAARQAVGLVGADPLLLGVAGEVRVHEGVAEARGVGEEVADGRGVGRLAQARLSGVVIAVQDRQFGEVGEDGGDGLVQVERAGLHQLQGGDGGDQLGEGGDPENGVGRHSRGASDRAGAIGGFEALAVGEPRGGNEAWHEGLSRGGGQGLIDGGDGHGSDFPSHRRP